MNKETWDAVYLIIAAVVGTGLIEVSPIKLNPWSWLLAPLRKAITGKLDDEIHQVEEEIHKVDSKVDSLQTEFNNHVNNVQERDALNSRRRILEFNDKVIQHEFHTQESWNQILEDIDTYEDYCLKHPDFPNNKCLLAIDHLKEQYEKHLDDNSFLEVDEDIKEVRKHKRK